MELPSKILFLPFSYCPVRVLTAQFEIKSVSLLTKYTDQYIYLKTTRYIKHNLCVKMNSNRTVAQQFCDVFFYQDSNICK